MFWLRFLYVAMLSPIMTQLCRGFGFPPIFITVISLLDEFFVILLFLSSVLIYNHIRIGRFEITLFLFLIIGSISCIKNDVPLDVSILGAFNIIKAMFIYICFRNLHFKLIEILKFFKWICYVFPFLVFSELLEIFVPNFRDIVGFTTNQMPDVRMGIKAIYGFLRPTQLTFFSGTLFFIYCFYIKKNKYYPYICVAMLLLTLKVKDFFAFVVSWACGLKKKIKITHLAIGGVLPVLLFYVYSLLLPRHFETYFGAEDEYSNARVALVYTSFRIMRDKLPFGVGFGRFASSTSEQIKSPVYHEYGIDVVYGLNYDGKSTFMDDSFWPMIFGETGIMGTLVYIILLVECFGPYLLKYVHDTTDKRYAMVSLVFIFMLVCSIAKTTLNGPPHSFLLWGLAGAFHYMAFDKKNTMSWK